MKHKERHPKIVEGCYGCKLTTVTLFAVETDWLRGVTAERHSARKIARDVEAYAGARKSGLRPPSSTVEGVRKAERQAESEARALKKLGVSSAAEAFQPTVEVM